MIILADELVVRTVTGPSRSERVLRPYTAAVCEYNEDFDLFGVVGG